MGLLDQVLGSMLGAPQRRDGNAGNSSIVDALTSILAQGGRNGSGGLGGLLGGLTGEPENSRSSGNQQNPVDNGSGGLGDLLDKLTQSGHGDIADSWVGREQNRPVAPHQLEKALGGDAIDKLSRQTGIPRDQLLEQLSKHLPSAVDQLTPEGRRPTSEEMNHW